MASPTMDSFLKKYYKQLHFNSMPDGVRARFMEWVKNDTLTSAMRIWLRDNMHKDAKGKYVQNNLPDPDNNTDLPEAEARKLFIAFQNAFAGMAADKNSFKDSDPQSYDFVENYFGDNKLFKVSPATQTCEASIKKIIDLLKNNSSVKAAVVRDALTEDNKHLFESEEKINKFINDCEQGKYNSDASLQNKIQIVADTLQYASWNTTNVVGQAITQADIDQDLTNVKSKSAFAMDPASIPQDVLNNFRAVYAKKGESGLLQTLYFNKTIRSRFAKYDKGAITGPIEKAESAVNWHDKTKENYVDEKLTDKKRPLERLQDWFADTYADTLKKYEELRGGKLFRRQEAKDIFKAIDSVKIKPSAGLGTLLSKAKEVEGKINNPVSRQHFKWFTETMAPIAEKMPKAVAGAWKSSTQMKAIIEEIILRATDPKAGDDAIAKAETAMEVMTAMKYGLMTSKIMDAMKQTQFSIFSDGQLSWNKNEGIQFVTRAFDKSIKAAFIGVGYAVTIARNKIMMSGMQFTNKNNKKGSKLAKHFAEENNTERQNLKDDNVADTNKITSRRTQLQNLNSGPDPINTRTLSGRQAQLDTWKAQIESDKVTMTQNKDKHDEYVKAEAIIQEDGNLNTRILTLDNEIGTPATGTGPATGLEKKIADKDAEIKNPRTYEDPNTHIPYPAPVQNAIATRLQHELDNLRNQKTQKETERQELKDKRNNPVFRANVIGANPKVVKNMSNPYYSSYLQYETAKNSIDSIQNDYDTLNNHITQFKEATAEIKELNENIERRKYALNHWSLNNHNKILYLENYWNYLQTGDTVTYGLSTKRAQKRLDKHKDAWLNKYIASHGLRAAA